MKTEQPIEKLNRISIQIDSSHNAGVITDDQYIELKSKTRALALDNIFAMMAKYCE